MENYTQKEIEILREGGRRLAIILDKVAKKAVVGVTLSELNDYAEQLIKEGGDKPAFLHYQPYGADYPYPASLCASVNDEIVHGISSDNGRVLKEGDVVGLDLGLNHKGFFTDMAVTVWVGKIDDNAKKLIETTKKALDAGIEELRVDNRLGDFGFVVSQIAKSAGFGVVDELGGHGVGRKVHDEPFIPNIGKKGKGEKIKEGMVLALEPMFNEGTKRVVLSDDGYTFKTADGKRSAHFEHTVLVTKEGPEILTKI